VGGSRAGGLAHFYSRDPAQLWPPDKLAFSRVGKQANKYNLFIDNHKLPNYAQLVKKLFIQEALI
jgi:hypothetical protein